jgi:hypothetical protein
MQAHQYAVSLPAGKVLYFRKVKPDYAEDNPLGVFSVLSSFVSSQEKARKTVP